MMDSIILQIAEAVIYAANNELRTIYGTGRGRFISRCYPTIPNIWWLNCSEYSSGISVTFASDYIVLHLLTHLPADEPGPYRTFYYADPDMVTAILTTILNAVNTLETQFLDLDSPRSRLTRGRGRATAAWSEEWGSTSF
jgi:hypothetical protein